MSGWDLGAYGNDDKKKVEFTKFPVGITKIRVLDEIPFTRWTHWLMKFKRSLNCPGRGCPICEIRKQQKANKETQTYAMARRVAINVYNYETKRVEVMEQGVTFFEDLRDLMQDLSDEGKDLRDTIIKVRRRGETKDDTSYRLDVEKHEPLTDEEKEEMQKDIVNLEEFFKPHSTEQILRIVNGEEWDDVMKQEQSETKEETSESSEKDEEYEVE